MYSPHASVLVHRADSGVSQVRSVDCIVFVITNPPTQISIIFTAVQTVLRFATTDVRIVIKHTGTMSSVKYLCV